MPAYTITLTKIDGGFQAAAPQFGILLFAPSLELAYNLACAAFQTCWPYSSLAQPSRSQNQIPPLPRTASTCCSTSRRAATLRTSWSGARCRPASSRSATRRIKTGPKNSAHLQAHMQPLLILTSLGERLPKRI